MKLEYINAMRQAAEEIRRLQRQNEILDAQVGVVHVFAAALGLQHASRGMSEDVAHKLEKMAAEAAHNLVSKAPAGEP